MKTNFESRSCEGKIRHKGRHGADKAASKIRNKDRGAEVNVYPCNFCGCWHVGNGVDYRENGRR